MLNNFIILLSLRYFRAKKKEKFVSIISGISLIGIAIGVAALIIVMSVMHGFHTELKSNIIGLGGDINISPLSSIIENSDSVKQKILENPFVQTIVPLVVGQALIIGNRTNSGALVKGVDVIDLKNKGSILDNVLDGSFAEYYGHDVVAMGCQLARNIGVYSGARIKMIAPNLLSTAFGSMPRVKEFTVVAIFRSGLYDYDSATILMPLDAAQKFLSLNEINLIELKIDNISFADSYSGILQNQLGSNLSVRSWIQDRRQFLNALAVERSAMFLILSLIMIVAGFNIVSSLFILVKDKVKDIAILKTIGASTSQIMLIFIINGMLIGSIGTIIGVILGLLFSYNIDNIRMFLEGISGLDLFDPAIYFLYNLPAVVRITDVLMISGMALLVSFLSTIYPSYRAASLNPVEAMRYE